jgi:hypothetical protein
VADDVVRDDEGDVIIEIEAVIAVELERAELNQDPSSAPVGISITKGPPPPSRIVVPM